jgi:hypothetical protein
MLNRDQKCSRESKIPVPISRQKVIVSPAKMEDKKNKSRLYMSTCSRRAQEEENFRKRNVTKQTEKTSSFQKPQSIQLKQDIEKLRRKVQ